MAQESRIGRQGPARIIKFSGAEWGAALQGSGVKATSTGGRGTGGTLTAAKGAS